MDDEDNDIKYFVGDIVGEAQFIVPPGRKCFYGIVIYIEKTIILLIVILLIHKI